MKAAVIGLGKIGLPLAIQIATRNVSVVGADINGELVEMLNAGQSPNHEEEGLGQALLSVRQGDGFRATISTKEAVDESDVVVVIVPLAVDNERHPDFSTIDAATSEVAAALRPGQLVIFETTVPVGTTRNRFGPMLGASGLVPGEDFYLAYSPERVFSGRVFRDLRRYPKLVGGVDAASAQAATDFYTKVLEFDPRPDLTQPNGVWNLGAIEVAELTKLVETTYRDVNIALANEFARYAETIGIDIGDVIDASNSQPFSHVHRPGLVGGHCIPVYPHLYLSGDPDAELPRAARRINDDVVGLVVDRVAEAIGGLEGTKVAILGAAYRGDVKEAAFSAVFPLVDRLEARGAVPVVHDPLYSASEIAALGLHPFQLGDPCDAAILQANHSSYRHLKPGDLPGCRVVMDVRGATDPTDWISAGIKHLQLGRG